MRLWIHIDTCCKVSWVYQCFCWLRDELQEAVSYWLPKRQEESIVQMCRGNLTKIVADRHLLSLEGQKGCEILCMSTHSSVSFDGLFHLNITKPGRHPSAFSWLADLSRDVFCFVSRCSVIFEREPSSVGSHFSFHLYWLRAYNSFCVCSSFLVLL